MAPAIPRQQEPAYVRTISAHKGMNDRDEPHVLGESNSVLLENLEINRIGARKRRNGVSDIGGRSDAPFGLWRAKDVTLDQDALFAVYQGVIYVVPGAGVLQERASDVTLVDALHAGFEGRYAGRLATYVSQVQVHDSDVSLASWLAVVTDNNTYTQGTGSTAGVGGVRPRGFAWFENRGWIFDNALAQNNETLWYSSLGDGLAYSANNTLQIEPGVGGSIRALLPLRTTAPTLLVFKEAAIAALHPRWGSSSALIPVAADQLDTVQSFVQLLSGNVGCVAQLSVQYVPGAPFGDVYFLAADGVRAILRGDNDALSGVSLPISDPILETIRRINYKFVHKAVSAVHDYKYHLGVPLDGAVENTHIITIDFAQGGWYLNTWDPKAFAVSRMKETRTQLWLQYNGQTADCSVTGSQTAHHVFKGFSGLLDPGGAPVIYQEDSRAFTWDGIDRRNAFDNLQLTVRNEAGETAVMALLHNVDRRGWTTFASLAFGGSTQDPILGVTPLPWGPSTGFIRTFRVSLADLSPGYSIQIRYVGQSDLSVPTVLDMAVGARPLDRSHDPALA